MKWSDLIRLAATNLWRRKLRSVLTMIGVMIGTASIVVMVSLGIAMNVGFQATDMKLIMAVLFLVILIVNRDRKRKVKGHA